MTSTQVKAPKRRGSTFPIQEKDIVCLWSTSPVRTDNKLKLEACGNERKGIHVVEATFLDLPIAVARPHLRVETWVNTKRYRSVKTINFTSLNSSYLRSSS